MIKITLESNQVFDDFRDQSGEYSTPAVAISAFETALEAHGYHMEEYVWKACTFGMVILDIFDGSEHVGRAHIAWCKVFGRSFSVVGQILR